MRNQCWIFLIIRPVLKKSNEGIFVYFIANQVLVQELENGNLTTVQIMWLVTSG